MTTIDRGKSIFPEWLDRLQVRYMNPLVRPLAPYLPGFAVIEHRGRKSGRAYSTPVNGFQHRGKFYVALGHGRTDWAKNVVAAGEADVRRLGRRLHVVNARIINREDEGPGLPLAARLAGRRLLLFVADIA
ncbi:nitroreductase family deazaflavin-dependent oxidoreductase [Nocardia pseudobrasiliensis]|uniref:Deazaflavin-dependent oxidoreductase (Nitroreductase family) n=1 Tax=Nocardia pseudobrasiliensis TaxID=45979 RepID=A0A370I4B0_9NOCA|nr:nitroreductase family deazaflavin-dependent oxidoreductase [Nocardia pseudobrasiliensis]RDI65525.1 deazaflavin-dependent oxidoreductase (nitroreductase family) [Nocardia pseudobrasiliensis]